MLPNLRGGARAYRCLHVGGLSARHRDIVRRAVASGADLPAVVGQGLRQSRDRPLPGALCARLATASGHIERIKIMKLLWDATGTEFGGRHALYELNYAGGREDSARCRC